jgi:hypothetical protein
MSENDEHPKVRLAAHTSMTLRLHPTLKRKLVEAARAKGRSMSREALNRLRWTFEAGNSPPELTQMAELVQRVAALEKTVVQLVAGARERGNALY